MKTKFLAMVLLAVGAVSWARAAETVPVFNAILTMGKDSRFVLVTDSGKSSKWLQVGDSFEGYAINAYDAKSGLLEVSRDGQSLKLPLVSGATVGAAVPSAATPASLADAEELFRVMRFDDMMNRMLEQQRKAMGPMFQQMTSKMALGTEDKEAVAAFQKKISDELMGAMMGPEMRADMARIYSEIFSKQELNSLMSFYGTPAGQALIEKQPDVQQKMMAVMMPRMQQVMPKIQQMGRDFAGELKAKHDAAAAAATPPAEAVSPAAGKD